MWRSSSVSGVGKAEHWATALTVGGKKLFDKALPNSQSRLREVYKHLGEHGRVLVVVDQPATIGALAVAVSPRPSRRRKLARSGTAKVVSAISRSP